MDRPPPPRGERRGDWQLLFVPRAAGGAVRRVRLSGRELATWRVLASVAAVALVVLFVLLGFAWPRSSAYGELVRENLELKTRLDAIDRKMGEVDRILLRLRLYDAQLDSVGGATGPHGPVPEGAFANHLPTGADDLELEAVLAELPLDGGGEGEPMEPVEESFRTATQWADEMADRLDGFLATMADVEPDFNRVLSDLEAIQALKHALPSVWPAEGLLTSGYGWRRNPFGGRRWRHHSGVDIGGQRGYAVFATSDATVASADWDGGYGKAIHLDHGYGLVTLYGHLSALLVKAGDHVTAGQKIGLMGSTGRSTGPHLHFEVHVDGHPVDPFDYLEVPPEALAPGVTPPQLLKLVKKR